MLIFNQFLISMSLIAVENNNTNFISLALDSGLDPNQMVDDECLLYIAAKCNSIDVVEQLLISGANPNIKSHEYETPLFIACHNKNLDCSRLLIDFGGEI